MNFITKNDLLAVIDEHTLSVLIENNESYLTEVESRAIEEMTAYLNTRYNTEDIFSGQNRNSLIVMYLADVMLYHLHSRIAPDNIPELRKERYENAKDWLEKVADGFTSPLLPSKARDEKLPIRSGSSLPKQKFQY